MKRPGIAAKVDPATKAALEDRARRERRTLSDLIRIILEDATGTGELKP